MWKDVAKAIRDHKSFVLTTHIYPEGDAIGAEVALAHFLRDLGKDVTIVNSSPTPSNCLFMDRQGDIVIYSRDFDAQVLERAEVAIIVDVNNWAHLGPFASALKKFDKLRICIDHHEGGDRGFAQIAVQDTSAAAAGLLVYELIVSMKGKITPRIAEAAYTALITDTGTFRFTNTDERVFRAAADLVAAGVEPFALHRSVFSKTSAAVKLLGSVIRTMETTADGRIAWIHATHDMFKTAGAEYEDSDGLLDVVRAIGEVEFCLFFKETAGGKIRVSLRSNGRVNVFEIAKRHGGGGHRMAAGMTVAGPMDAAIRSVIDECAKIPLP